MPKQKMYRKGDKILSIQQQLIYNQPGYVFWNDKLMHYSFLTSMPFRVVLNAYYKGILYEAIKNEEVSNGN